VCCWVSERKQDPLSGSKTSEWKQDPTAHCWVSGGKTQQHTVGSVEARPNSTLLGQWRQDPTAHSIDQVCCCVARASWVLHSVDGTACCWVLLPPRGRQVQVYGTGRAACQTHIHTHARTHTHTHAHTQTRACTDTRTCTHTRIYTHVRTHMAGAL